MTSLNPYRDINVHASAQHYSFTSPSNPTAPSLVVDRPSGNLWLSQKSLPSAKRVTSISGILGIIRLRLDRYIIVITKAKQVGLIKGHQVYKVLATEFLPLRERPLHDTDEDNYLKLLEILLKNGPMYFSYSFDLTNTFQRQMYANLDLPLWQRTDNRFFWNRHISSDLIDLCSNNQAVNPFILPTIFGMMSISQTSIKSTPFTFVLITRRSRFRAGTRFFSRGIDENGNVSNFNETEQIVVIGNAVPDGIGHDRPKTPSGRPRMDVLSYVQTRGSVPVYWAEINNLKYTPKLLVRNIDPINAARKHFQEQVTIYGDVYCVNLVNQTGREQNVKKAYEEVVRNMVSSHTEAEKASAKSSEQFHVIESQQTRKLEDRIHYTFFDFHHECRNLKWHRALLLLDLLKDALAEQGYYHASDGAEGAAVRRVQNSVVRSNCMDCLDRTNVIQSMLARYTLQKQLVDLGIIDKTENIENFTAFEFLFRNVWADNADVVSKAYSGTGALKTDFTRTGKRTQAGALQDLRNSIVRYCRNNFMDGPRQDAYDLFLGNYLPSTSGIGSSLLFIDRRPLIVQSIPYVLAASIFLIFVALVTPTKECAFALRLFLAFWIGIALWSGNFIKNHGMLYVNWPKLRNLTYANEGYNEAMGKIHKDVILGRFVPKPRHERGQSSLRLSALEEGKTRIE